MIIVLLSLRNWFCLSILYQNFLYNFAYTKHNIHIWNCRDYEFSPIWRCRFITIFFFTELVCQVSWLNILEFWPASATMTYRINNVFHILIAEDLVHIVRLLTLLKTKKNHGADRALLLDCFQTKLGMCYFWKAENINLFRMKGCCTVHCLQMKYGQFIGGWNLIMQMIRMSC